MTLHPLDPLSAEEIRRVVAVLERERGIDERWRFGSIELREPAKEDLLSGAAELPREAEALLWRRGGDGAHKAIVSLARGELVEWIHHPGCHAGLTGDEDDEVAGALAGDDAYLAALARRGLDPGSVHLEVWGVGGSEIPEAHRGRRVAMIDVWRHDGGPRNAYASPVSGLHFMVDLDAMAVLEVLDSFTVEPPEEMGQLRPELVPDLTPREDLRPLEVSQPEGVSFTLDGHLLEWQNWSLRVGFNAREGLVIHSVGYRDGGRLRPVAHRMSIAELVSPYRDPGPDFYWRMAYDAGEWGLGLMANSLALGCDCLGEIVYMDAVLHDSRGVPRTLENAVCIHEEDDGILWKHVDPLTGESDVRRRRRLVVSFSATIANYDYVVYWRFHQDGGIECEIRATGIVLASHFLAGETPTHGAVVDERTYAPMHQHFAVARLDLDIDGEANTVVVGELEAPAVGPEDPNGLAVEQRRRPLRTELEGRQDYDWASHRTWTVVNPDASNRFGEPVGYKLVPHSPVPALFDPDSPTFRRAATFGHDLWVTPYDREERWPCGEFIVGAERDSGLPVWTAADRPIENTDVVLWHVFGLLHETRPEDWPVMPTESASFQLRPVGFFDRNPSLDVPPPEHCRTSHA